MLIVGLQLALDMNILEVDVFGESMLVADKIKGLYEAKEEHIKEYIAKAMELVKQFKMFQII